jgi:ribosomal protein L30E
LDQEMSEELLKIVIEYGAYKLGCERALELLENGDAGPADADKVIKLLKDILNG